MVAKPGQPSPSAPPGGRSAAARQLAADLRGIARLATDATIGVTNIAEGVNQSVWATLGFAGGASAQRARGITGAVHNSVRGVTRLVGQGTELALASLMPALEGEAGVHESPRRAALLAALNGAIGDRLAARGNPLATALSLRLHGQPLHQQRLSPALPSRVLLLVHGLGMNELQWQPKPPARGHADTLAPALGAQTLGVRYNSGQHVSDNGRELALQLERLLGHWPVPLQSISVLAHSMGGLVMRSALHQAQQHAMQWPHKLEHLVFLGTPHHGAPLERAGNFIDGLLDSTAYSAPFAALAQLRSAGITDLRRGLLLHSDWHGIDRFEARADTRTPVPLPARVACYAVAATTARLSGMSAERTADAALDRLADGWVGDGLVPLPSALGRHADARHRLAFAAEHTHVFFGLNHMQLLYHPEVTLRLQSWLLPA